MSIDTQVLEAIQEFLEGAQSHHYLEKGEVSGALYHILKKHFPQFKVYRDVPAQGSQMWLDLALYREDQPVLLIDLQYAPSRTHPALLAQRVVNPLSRRKVLDSLENCLMYIDRFEQERVLALCIDENPDSFRQVCADITEDELNGIQSQGIVMNGPGIMAYACFLSKKS